MYETRQNIFSLEENQNYCLFPVKISQKVEEILFQRDKTEKPHNARIHTGKPRRKVTFCRSLCAQPA